MNTKLDQLRYTLILHEARKKLGLNMLEYSVADLIYHLSNNPNSKIPGWCYASKRSMAEIIGISERSVYYNLNKLLKHGLIEKDKNTDYLKASKRWYENVVIVRSAKSSYTLQSAIGDAENHSVVNMQGLHTNDANIADNNNRDSDTDKKNNKSREQVRQELEEKGICRKKHTIK